MRENTDQKNSEYEHFLCKREPPIMIPAGEKVECLLLVNYSAKTNDENNNNHRHCEYDST